MNQTVLSGTANISNIEGIEVGAKTGTAEEVMERVYMGGLLGIAI